MIYSKDSEVVAQVLEVKCTPASVDPFGQVAGGHIDLRGPVFTAVLLRAIAQNASPRGSYLLAHKGRIDDAQVMLADVCLDKGFPDYVPVGSLVSCVVIERFSWHVNSSRCACLVIRQDPASKHCYRIGTVNCPAHWVTGAKEKVVKIL